MVFLGSLKYCQRESHYTSHNHTSWRGAKRGGHPIKLFLLQQYRLGPMLLIKCIFFDLDFHGLIQNELWMATPPAAARHDDAA